MTTFCGCMIGPNDPDPRCPHCHGSGEPNASALEAAIQYARGEGSGQQLADLTAAQKNVAELGARRALSYLQGERAGYPTLPPEEQPYNFP